jgi:GTPase SAR1 family protein
MKKAKVVLVGATNTGKTAIVNQYIFSDFTIHLVLMTQPAYYQKILTHQSR